MLNKQTILSYLDEAGRPVYETTLFSDMNITPETAPVFYDVISELESGGEIIRTKKNKYALPSRMGLILGALKTSPKGFGFVKSMRGDDQDIFIPASEIKSAMHGDLVYCKVIEEAHNGFKREGSIVKIIKRANNTVVGTFRKSKNYGFVVPDNAKIFTDVFIGKRDFGKAKNGQKVVAKITEWGDKRSLPAGEIVEVLGNIKDKGVDILSVIRKYELPEAFSKKVVRAALNTPETVKDADITGRKDYRDKNVITIDGVDAKDLDDAIYLEKNEDGSYKLSVHIADVAHYVRRGTAIDKEALKRGNSVYLIDRVIPMLPKALSNGICSLNEGVDRLTMSVDMLIDKSGKVKSYELHEGIIKSKKRLNYDEVSEILDGDGIDENSSIDKDIQTMLFEMKELAEILNARRHERGSINFDFPEAYIVLDNRGKPTSIKERKRGVSDKIIEEFMLISNETIAEYVYWLELPFVYRVHEQPDMERFETLNKFISNLGQHLHVKDDKIHPKEVQGLIESIAGSPQEKVINKMVLRSLKQARYSPECLGHFGLSAKYYCHFTSPIRRYPDLEIHRLLKENMRGEIDKKRFPELETEVEEVSAQSSKTERIAENAEREVDDMKKCEFMEDKVGMEFDAIISGINKFGIYSELDNTIEGFTKVSNLEDDYYLYDETSLSFVGERTNKRYGIGDALKIRVARVDVLQREIDFEIVRHNEFIKAGGKR